MHVWIFWVVGLVLLVGALAPWWRRERRNRHWRKQWAEWDRNRRQRAELAVRTLAEKELRRRELLAGVIRRA